MKIAMIMLAAGNSRRFGANKLLYEIDGIPMYRHVLEQLDDTKKKIENIYSEYSDITEAVSYTHLTLPTTERV